MNNHFAALLKSFCEEMGAPDVELLENESYAFSFDNTVIALTVDAAETELVFSGYVSDSPADPEEADAFHRAMLAMNGNFGDLPCSLYYDAEYNGVLLAHSSPLRGIDSTRFSRIMSGLAAIIAEIKGFTDANFHLPVYADAE